LKQVKDVPGTASHRSIVNIRGYTIYFHGGLEDKTGFYLYDGVTSQQISRPIQPYIDGITSTNYDNVVAWREGDEYRAYVGDIAYDQSNNQAFKIRVFLRQFVYKVINPLIIANFFTDTTF
jgi:hypothetical protein